MPSSRSASRLSVMFDDDHAGGDGGLTLVATRGQKLGQVALVEELADVGPFPGTRVATLVLAMVTFCAHPTAQPLSVGEGVDRDQRLANRHERGPFERGSHKLDGLMGQARGVCQGAVAGLAVLAIALAQKRGRVLPVALAPPRSGRVHSGTAIACGASDIDKVGTLSCITREYSSLPVSTCHYL